MQKDLVVKKRTSTKSRLLKRYEELLERIEDIQASRRNLEEGLRVAIPRIQSQIRPLLTDRDHLIRKRLFRLDELADEFGIGKHERGYFQEFMTEQAAEVLDRVGFGDMELGELFEKYAGEPLKSDAKVLAPIAQRFRDEFGIDIDVQEMLDVGVDNFLNEHGEEIRKKQAEKQEAKDAEDLKNFDPAAKQKVSRQQRAMLQDARAIYLRLVKKYHPDRETDEAARIRKTELIQQITSVYEESDFLTLLKLQIELLEEEEMDAKTLAEDMLKRYTRILQKQLDEIQQEVSYLKFTNKWLFENFFGFDGKFNERRFKRFRKMVREEIERTQRDLNDSKQRREGWFRDWIKGIKAYQQETAD
ncbi:hypothetical protein [Persicitalea jodogahamensis]|uniref:Molecular chaperone DnaJ n=1 Tax=Persicitalea jodogahamensis TaxID=402147 RepID=A0A8J3D3V6_9BACT|nr:hypothetical protein [Persicitalea jodogahamensis]GHB70636.1 molecular chaperone DnaJ [Persicitalea jodogahamensis]